MTATTPSPATPAAEAEPISLKAFIVGNVSLITLLSIFTGLAAFALTLKLGWFGPLLRGGVLLLAVVVWFELLHQLPKPLLLSNLRSYPSEYNWRLIAFGYLLQVLMVALLLSAAYAAPSSLAPLIALVIAALALHRLPDSVNGLIRVLVGIGVFEMTLGLVAPEQ